jgi:hypothetical protein
MLKRGFGFELTELDLFDRTTLVLGPSEDLETKDLSKAEAAT